MKVSRQINCAAALAVSDTVAVGKCTRTSVKAKNDLTLDGVVNKVDANLRHDIGDKDDSSDEVDDDVPPRSKSIS